MATTLTREDTFTQPSEPTSAPAPRMGLKLVVATIILALIGVAVSVAVSADGTAAGQTEQQVETESARLNGLATAIETQNVSADRASADQATADRYTGLAAHHGEIVLDRAWQADAARWTGRSGQ